MNDIVKVAWMVQEAEEDHACIVFAPEDGAQRAISLGSIQMNKDPEDCTASRAEEYDQYAEQGKVPHKKLVEDGWWFECSQCGHTILESKNLVEDGRLIFCEESCRQGFAARVWLVNKEFEHFQERVKRNFPSLTFTEFKGGWPITTPLALFTFPGALHGGGRIRLGPVVLGPLGQLEVSVAQGDLEAWERLRSQDPASAQEAGS